MQSIKHQVKQEIYQGLNIHIYVTDDLVTKVGELGGEADDTFAAVTLWRASNEGAITIVYEDMCGDNSLVHEAVHAAGRALKSIGWFYDIDNDEPFAYLTDFIFRESKKAFVKYDKKYGG